MGSILDVLLPVKNRNLKSEDAKKKELKEVYRWQFLKCRIGGLLNVILNFTLHVMLWIHVINVRYIFN